MKIAELFAEIGFKFDTIKLKEVAKSIGDLNVNSLVSTAAVVKLGDVIKNLIVDSVTASNALTTMSQATGLDTDYIQRFEKFAQIMGSTKEEADSFLNTIGKLQLAISQGKGDATPFVLLGINPLGKTKEELAALINQRFSDENFLKQWAGNFAKGAKNVDEIRAELKRQIGGGLGISDSLLRPLSSKDFGRQLNPETSTLSIKSKEEIENATIALSKFREITTDINTEFQRTVDVLLPGINDLFSGFKDNGGLKFLMDTLAAFGRAAEIIGLGAQWSKIGLMNMANVEQGAMVEASRLGTRMQTMVKEIKSSINVTVHSNTPEEFVRRFDPIWKKHIQNADLQFGQQT